MALTQILAMVRKDLQVHYSDRRAVIMSFVAPIAIASFLGAITGGRGTPGEPAKIPIAIVDQDASTVTRAIVSAVQNDKTLQVTVPSAEEARESVKRGDVTVAVIIPAGFGEASGLAFFGGGTKPDVSILYDPSHRAEMGLVRGLMTQHVMEAVSREMFGGGSGRKLAEQALLNLDKSGMADSQRALLRESADVGPAVLHAVARRGCVCLCAARRHHAAVLGEGGSGHRSRRCAVQRLRPFIRGHGHSVPPFRHDRYGRRHSARTSTRIVEAAAKRPDLPDGAAPRKGAEFVGDRLNHSGRGIPVCGHRLWCPHPGERRRVPGGM